MNEKVEQFLAGKRKEASEEELKKRNLHLIELGLYDVEYAEGNTFSREYPEMENGKYCRRTPVAVTDEEYAAICAAVPEKQKKWPEWPVAKILFVVALIIYGVGFLAGIVTGVQTSYFMDGQPYYEFSWLAALSMWLTTLIGGTLLLGFSEHLVLLEKIGEKSGEAKG